MHANNLPHFLSCLLPPSSSRAHAAKIKPRPRAARLALNNLNRQCQAPLSGSRQHHNTSTTTHCGSSRVPCVEARRPRLNGRWLWLLRCNDAWEVELRDVAAAHAAAAHAAAHAAVDDDGELKTLPRRVQQRAVQPRARGHPSAPSWSTIAPIYKACHTCRQGNNKRP